jgi:translation initiation factor IF-1
MSITNALFFSPANALPPLRKRPSLKNGQLYKTIMVLVAMAVMLVGFSVEASAQAFSVGMFRPWPGYSTGDGRFVAGDFNGDGKTDLVHPVADNQYANIWLSKGDGTFTINQFSPWPGYAMGDGYFIAGDFNGDGKTDLAHIVTDSQYANIWLSNGDGTFTVKTFSPWGGYAMGNGYFVAGDFNGDGKTDLAHIVTDSQYANIWLSNGDGTFTIKQFSPWGGYAMGNGYFLAGDFNGDGKTDLAHIVTDNQYANIWLSNGNGTFTVKQFSPWNGYAMGDGHFLVGDFNGDGKADLAHPVADNQYANIWLSNGDGTFTIKQFSPWNGYAMGDGYFLATDLNKDGKTDLVHFVTDNTYANVWVSKGDGSFAVQPFSPWNGYAIGIGYFLTADFNGDRKGDLVHIVTNNDYVHPWISVLPAPGEFSQDGLEVTQEIQDMPHSVPLVANKQTWVRVYLSVNAAASVTLPSAVLNVRNTATNAVTQVVSSTPVTVNPAQNGQLRTKRESLSLSFNFPLPTGLTAVGNEEFTLASLSNPLGPPLTCSNCVAQRRTVSFVGSAPLRVRIVGLQYTTGTPPQTFTPSATDFALLPSWLTRAYPVPQVISTQLTTKANITLPFSGTTTTSCNQANAQLSALRATEVGGGGVDARTHYLGMVANGGGFMRGCASSPPAPAGPTAVASGPTGSPFGPGPTPVNVVGDTDGSFGDWYGGHELAHTFGRLHPGFCNGNSASDPSFPFPNGQISTNDGAFTGLDVGDAGNGIPPTVLPGASRFEIMTYCNQPQWLSSYTYEGIRGELNVEDPSGGGPPSGGGALGRQLVTNTGIVFDVNCRCAAVEPSHSTPPTRTPIVGLKESPTPTLEQEIAPKPPTPFGERPKLMVGENKPAPPKPAQYAPPRVEHSVIFPQLPEQFHAAQASRFKVTPGRFVSVVATVNLSKQTAKILYINHVVKAVLEPSPVDRAASLRITGRNGRVLGEYAVTVRLDTDVPSKEDRTGLIDASIPDHAEVGTVELFLNKKLMDRILVAKNAPILKNLKASRSRSGILLAWEASGADANMLTYVVQLSADRGETWETAAIGLKERRFELDLLQTSVRPPDLARVIANDGYNDSAPVVVSLTRPEPQ